MYHCSRCHNYSQFISLYNGTSDMMLDLWCYVCHMICLQDVQSHVVSSFVFPSSHPSPIIHLHHVLTPQFTAPSHGLLSPHCPCMTPAWPKWPFPRPIARAPSDCFPKVLRKFFLSNCLDTLWTLFCHMDVFFILGQLIYIDIALRNKANFIS